MIIPDIEDIEVNSNEKAQNNDILGLYDSGIPFIIPMEDPETTSDIRSIDRKTKEDVRIEHRILISSDWECNTIATITVETLIGILYSHIVKNGVGVLDETDSDSLNFYDLITISSSYKENTSADKTGNLNIMFLVGKDVEKIIYDEDEPEYIEPKAKYSFADNIGLTQAFQKIDALARRRLKDNYNILMPKDFTAIGVCYIFMKNLYRFLLLKLSKSESNSIIINFNDILEFYAVKKKDNPEGADIYIRPGMGAKLIIKSDVSTEADIE